MVAIADFKSGDHDRSLVRLSILFKRLACPLCSPFSRSAFASRMPISCHFPYTQLPNSRGERNGGVIVREAGESPIAIARDMKYSTRGMVMALSVGSGSGKWM